LKHQLSVLLEFSPFLVEVMGRPVDGWVVYGETLGDLEPVYDLFTIMGEIIPSESLSHVTYTGINSMHSQKTKQPYIRSAKKNGTRKKKNAVE